MYERAGATARPRVFFTTQSATAVLEKIRHEIKAGPPVAATMLGTFPLDNLAAIQWSRQTGTAPTFSTSFLPTVGLVVLYGLGWDRVERGKACFGALRLRERRRMPHARADRWRDTYEALIEQHDRIPVRVPSHGTRLMRHEMFGRRTGLPVSERHSSRRNGTRRGMRRPRTWSDG